MKATVWVYVRSESYLYTVGFYAPDGNWHSDSDHDSKKKAADRVHYLNGGESKESESELKTLFKRLWRRIWK